MEYGGTEKRAGYRGTDKEGKRQSGEEAKRRRGKGEDSELTTEA